MVMPSDERQMPGEGWRNVRANYGSGREEGKSTGDSSGEWVFGSVLAVLAVLSVG